MGEHCYGRRSKNRSRKIIVRRVPAIVSIELWEAAQQVLRSNLIMAVRTDRVPFLLRGLIKCAMCRRTYAGMRMKLPQRDHYYRCVGRQFDRGFDGLSEKKCTAKSLNGDYVERLVWADIESFLRNPGDILERLRERVSMQDSVRLDQQKELENFTALRRSRKVIHFCSIKVTHLENRTRFQRASSSTPQACAVVAKMPDSISSAPKARSARGEGE